MNESQSVNNVTFFLLLPLQQLFNISYLWTKKGRGTKVFSSRELKNQNCGFVFTQQLLLLGLRFPAKKHKTIYRLFLHLGSLSLKRKQEEKAGILWVTLGMAERQKLPWLWTPLSPTTTTPTTSLHLRSKKKDFFHEVQRKEERSKVCQCKKIFFLSLFLSLSLSLSLSLFLSPSQSCTHHHVSGEGGSRPYASTKEMVENKKSETV